MQRKRNQNQIKQAKVEQWSNHDLPSVPLRFKLKPMQKAIIVCNQQNDVLVNLPTGYGKSMLYQYQALLPYSKSIVVIVPLKALLWDSIVEANRLGIKAAELSPQNIDKFDMNLPPKLLFATPERLYQNFAAYQTLAKLYELDKISLFVIDEAHCVCEWGNDFRKDYAKLKSLRQNFPEVRILAMTATAPPQIREEITQKLNIRNCYFFFASYNRPNLIYEVYKCTKQGLKDNIQNMIKHEFPNQAGIIYCQTIKLCQELHKQLKNTIKCDMFHSKISVTKRQKTLNEFKNQPGKIIIATICFGMGINKPDVRFVIHAGISFSIENYYQQSGRGGRDGKPARCILMSYPQQQSTLLYLLQKTKSQYKTKANIYNNRKFQLETMLKYSMNRTQCRKKFMFKIMGQEYGNCKDFCDICTEELKVQKYDFTEIGCKIMNTMVNAKSVLTIVELRNILKGKSMNKNRFNDLKSISGLLKKLKQQEITQIIQQMVNQDYFTTLIKRNKFAMIKRIIVNRRKSIDRIMLSRTVQPKILKRQSTDPLIEFTRKRLNSLTITNPSIKQSNYVQSTLQPFKNQPTPYQYIQPNQDDDMRQAIMISAQQYQQFENNLNSYPSEMDYSGFEGNDISNDDPNISKDQDCQQEQEQIPEIDQDDIKNVMPCVMLEIEGDDDWTDFNQNILLKSNFNQNKQDQSLENFKLKWNNLQKLKVNPVEQIKIPQQKEKIVDPAKDLNKKQKQESKEDEDLDGDHGLVLQSIFKKYGISSSLKRKTEMPDKKQNEQQIKKLKIDQQKRKFL